MGFMTGLPRRKADVSAESGKQPPTHGCATIGRGGRLFQAFHTASSTRARSTKACRDLSDSLTTLYFLVLSHVVIAKPLHTFARHAFAIPAMHELMTICRWSARMRRDRVFAKGRFTAPDRLPGNAAS
jgi:hypothetical protein